MAKCKGCQAEIVWIKTLNGKNMPCNAEKTTVVAEDGRTVVGHIPHWSTCPQFKQFKRASDLATKEAKNEKSKEA